MAKRRSVKSSRRGRKVQRERSERAKQHGLPAKDPIRVKRTPSGTHEGERQDRGPRDDDEASKAVPTEPVDMTLWERVRKLPQSVQLGILAGLVLVVVVVASQLRSVRSEDASAVPAPSLTAPEELVGPITSAFGSSSADPAPSAATSASETGVSETEASEAGASEVGASDQREVRPPVADKSVVAPAPKQSVVSPPVANRPAATPPEATQPPVPPRATHTVAPPTDSPPPPVVHAPEAPAPPAPGDSPY